MSFSRATVRRFNDVSEVTPSPLDYDPKMPSGGHHGAGVAQQKAERFEKDKGITPGPNQYHLPDSFSRRSSTLPRRSTSAAQLGRSNSRQTISRESSAGRSGSVEPPERRSKCKLSTASAEDVFVTPMLPASTKKDSAAKRAKAEATEMAERCKALEQEVQRLNKEMEELRRSREDKDRQVKALKTDLAEHKARLEDKMGELEAATKEREALETKRDELREEIEQNDARIESLRVELSLVAKDNESLEAKSQKDSAALEEDRQKCEAQATFLHFTQEQLSLQLSEQEAIVLRLQGEADQLREQVAGLHVELEAERERMREVVEVYQSENEEALEEFKKIKDDNEMLQIVNAALSMEKDAAQTTLANLSEGIKELQQRMAELSNHADEREKKNRAICEELDSIKSDLDVSNNDKSALLEEVHRLTEEKRGLEMDVGQTAAKCEKLKADLEASEAEQEMTSKARTEAEQKLKETHALLEEIRVTASDYEKQVSDLRLEVSELEMKTSSLEGSLDSASCLAKENSELSAKVISIEQEKCDLLLRVKATGAEVDELKETKKDLNETCVVLRDRMIAAEERTVELKAAAVEWSKHCELVSGALEESQCIILTLEEQAVDRNEEHGRVTAKLEEQLAEAMATIKEAQATITGLDEAKHAAESAGKAEMDKHGDLLKEKEEALSKAKEETADLKKSLSDMSHELESTKKCYIEANDLSQQLEFKLEAAEDQLRAKESERKTLVEMNAEQSTKIEEDLVALKRLQQREQELESRLRSSSQEEAASVKELRQRLDQTVAQKADMEMQARNMQEAFAELKSELSSAQSRLDSLAQSLEDASSERDNHANELAVARAHSQDQQALLAQLQSKAAQDETFLATFQARMEARAAECVEMEAKVKDMDEKCQLAETRNERYEELKYLLLTKTNENETLLADKDQRDKVIEELRTKLSEEESYRVRFEQQAALIEPFKEQLELFQIERDSLVSQNQAKQADLMRLAEQHGKAMGHQNHRQKINHMVKLKTDNQELKARVGKLEAELAKARKKILTGGKFAAVGKENNASVLPAVVGKSPLAPRNRK